MLCPRPASLVRTRRIDNQPTCVEHHLHPSALTTPNLTISPPITHPSLPFARSCCVQLTLALVWCVPPIDRRKRQALRGPPISQHLVRDNLQSARLSESRRLSVWTVLDRNSCPFILHIVLDVTQTAPFYSILGAHCLWIPAFLVVQTSLPYPNTRETQHSTIASPDHMAL